jgi:hypothetical protein
MVGFHLYIEHTDTEDENDNNSNAQQAEEELFLTSYTHAKGGQYDPDTIQTVQDARGHDEQFTKSKERAARQFQKIIISGGALSEKTKDHQVQR